MSDRRKAPRQADRFASDGIIPMLRSSVRSEPEVLDVVSFAEQILKVRLYPGQRTILRVVFLDVEHMSAYDRTVVDEWRTSFGAATDVVRGSPADLWDRIEAMRSRGFWHFREVMLLIGRRGGKNFLGAIAVCYLLYRLILTGSPQQAMGIDLDKDLVVFLSATNREQSKDTAFRDVVTMVTRCGWFEPYVARVGSDELSLWTPRDLERRSLLTATGMAPEDAASLRIRALSSSAPASRGPAGVMAWFDELAHTPVTPSGFHSGEELYTAVLPSLDQAREHALVLITTSPYSRTGQAYEVYQHATEIDPTTGKAAHPQILLLQLRSWDPYVGHDDPAATGGVAYPEPPESESEILEWERQRNPQKFAVERLSQWASVQSAYLDPAFVDRAYLQYCPDCGRSVTEPEWRGAGGCPLCGGAGSLLVPVMRDHGLMVAHRGHADPAELHDSFAAAICHLQVFRQPDGSEVAHVVADRLMAWAPGDYGGELPVLDIKRQLAEVIMRFPTMTRFTYDQHGSAGTISEMREELRRRGSRVRVGKLPHTQANNRDREEIVKEALAAGWIHLPKDALGPGGSCLLAEEMKTLQLINGRVVKPTTGPIRTNDLWTAFSVVAHALLGSHYGGGVREALARLPLAAGLPGGRPAPLGVTFPGRASPPESAQEGGRRKGAREVLAEWDRRGSLRQHFDPTRGRGVYGPRPGRRP